MTLTLDELSILSEGWDFEAKAAQGRDGSGALPRSFWPTYSGMANGQGGRVVLGVEEKDDRSFRILGLRNPARVETDLWNQLENRKKVSINVLTRDDVTLEEIDGKSVLLIRVPRAPRSDRRCSSTTISGTAPTSVPTTAIAMPTVSESGEWSPSPATIRGTTGCYLRGVDPDPGGQAARWFHLSQPRHSEALHGADPRGRDLRLPQSVAAANVLVAGNWRDRGLGFLPHPESLARAELAGTVSPYRCGSGNDHVGASNE